MGNELESLKRAILTKKEREILGRSNPRWDLDPPQREEYETDAAYVAALKAYANRVRASDAPSAK